MYVYVHLLPHPIGLTAYSSLVEVNQRASLDRNGSSASVSTWSVQRLGTVGSRHLAMIRNDVRNQIDHFINVYRSVNPPLADRAMPPSTVCVWPYEEMYGDDVKDGRGYDYTKRLAKAVEFDEDMMRVVFTGHR